MRIRVSVSSLSLLSFVFPMAAVAQLSIAPPSQSVSARGNSATYVLTLTNSSGSSQTFVPSVSGSVDGSWGVQLPASVTLASGASQNFNVVLTPPLNLANASFPFTVTATNGTGLTFTANGTFVLAVPAVTPAPSSLILLLTALAFAGLYAAPRKLRQVFSRG